MDGMRFYIRKTLGAAAMAVLCALPAHAVDTYEQTFDNMGAGATVDGADSWSVLSEDKDGAMVESGETATGSGKSVKFVGAVAAPQAEREAAYGNLSPTWVEYVVKAAIGRDPREVPPKASPRSISAPPATSWSPTARNGWTPARSTPITPGTASC
jgi:hypothetical protein